MNSRDSNPVDLQKGSFRSGSAEKARASRGVWGHAPEKILRYVPLRYKHKPQRTEQGRKRQCCILCILGLRSLIDPICCNFCVVPSMFLRLVLANPLVSLRDINLTLWTLALQKTRDGVILWEFWSSVERGYFTSELSLPKSYNNSEKTVYGYNPALFLVLSVSC